MTATSTDAGMGAARRRLREIIDEKSLMRGDFVLASGQRSSFLFDMKKTMLDPEGIDLLADAVLERTASIDADHIGGLAMGAVPLVVAAVLKSRRTERPLRGFWVRKEQKGHGTRNSADGYVESGARVVIVEDVTTTGDSVMKAIAEARDRGCVIAAVITVVDRLQGAKEKLAGEGIALMSLFTREDFGL